MILSLPRRLALIRFSSISLRSWIGGLVFLLNGMLLPQARAVGPTQVVLTNSIGQVETPPATGPVNPRRPFISRRALKASESGAEMEFEVALKMRNFAELQQRLTQGELIPPKEMAAKYSPLPSDTQAVTDWLTAQGFKITHQDGSRLAVFARGKVSLIQQALHVNFARVTFENKEFTSAITPPSVPNTISSMLVGINGLQPHLRARRHLIPRTFQPNSLTGPGAPYLPSQIAKAYHANTLYSSNITGAGQTIAIVIDTFPATSDLTSFWQTYSVNQSIGNIQFIQVVSGTLPAPSGEETLDVEWSSSIAPGSHVRVYAATDLGFADLDQVYGQVYTDATTHPEYGIHQMSMSFGLGEADIIGQLGTAQLQTDAQYFANLVSAGITPFASSGDDGNDPDSNNTIQAESPASDPNVIGVGGTSMHVDSAGNVTNEVVWNNSSGSTGGGTSSYFTRPAWQTGTGLPSGIMRAVPDVAATADPNTGAVVIQGGVQSVVGGTSWSSPTWAGYCALFNQARANAGLPPLGALGPKIYPLLGTSNFRDITSGSNGFSAGTGYDLATGIGVPNVQALAVTLVGTQTAPVYQTLAPTQNATFNVISNASPLSYQWQRMPIGTGTWSNLSDDGTYSGTTSASLTIQTATTAMSGDQFQCVVNTSNGNITSSPPSVLVIDTPLVVSTLAGQVGVTGSQNGTGTGAKFNVPSEIAADTLGNIYVADYSNDTIRKVTPAGMVTTPYGSAGVAGSSNTGTGQFNTPNAVAIDSSNNIYVADSGNNTIRKITSAGVISTLAGSAGHTGSQNGTGAAARFNTPQGIAVDNTSGNIYVADTVNHTIRKITSAGVVTTLAGRAGIPGYVDSTTGTLAEFNSPLSVAVDSSGNVYVADLNNDVIRKITPAGAVTTAYGQIEASGRADGIGTSARFNAPMGLAFDASNNLYVTDSNVPPDTTSTSSGNNTLRRISTAGVVSTIAGNPGIIGSANGLGSNAQFYSLQGVAVTSAGVYLSDTLNHTIRASTPAPVISVAATLPNASEPNSTAGQFTVTRTGSTAAALSVAYSLSGTAVNGTDYSTLPGNVTIPIGASSATIAVAPLYDSQATNSRSLQLTVSSSVNYLVGNPSSATVTIAEPTTYQTWRQSTFGANVNNPAIAGDLADPNHNGVPNLLEYAFNANPLVDGSNPLPQESLTTVNGNQYLTITYTQLNNNDPNLAYTVQVTSDLTQQTDQWHSGASYTTLVSQQASGGVTQVTVRDNVAVTQATQRFIRVQVSDF